MARTVDRFNEGSRGICERARQRARRQLASEETRVQCCGRLRLLRDKALFGPTAVLVKWRKHPLTAPVSLSHNLPAAAIARPNRSDDFIRSQYFSKSRRGPVQRSSSIALNMGTSSRRVASVRNNRASFHPLNNDSDRRRALRIEGCHSPQTLGMSSRWGY